MLVGTIYAGQHKGALVLSDAAKRRYRKELIYVGKFIKKTADSEQPFEVESGTLSHWLTTFKQMNRNGVAVPLPNKHTEESGAKKATMVDMELGINEQGKQALYGIFDFNDQESEKLHKNSDVSIYVPDSPVYDGFGNEYVRPIRHVAFTDYPVVAGLGPAALVASFNGAEGKKKMAIDEKALATKLGINPDDPKLDELLVAAIDALIEKAKAEPAKPVVPPAPAAAASAATTVPVVPAPAATVVNPGILTMIKDSRATKIQALVLSGKITTAVATDLTTSFCSDTALTAQGLALSSNTPINDGFEGMIAALQKNQAVVNLQGQTGAQLPEGVTLSADGKQINVNPLIAKAEETAKMYASK